MYTYTHLQSIIRAIIVDEVHSGIQISLIISRCIGHTSGGLAYDVIPRYLDNICTDVYGCDDETSFLGADGYFGIVLVDLFPCLTLT